MNGAARGVAALVLGLVFGGLACSGGPTHPEQPTCVKDEFWVGIGQDGRYDSVCYLESNGERVDCDMCRVVEVR